jgi:hypothetical protein
MLMENYLSVWDWANSALAKEDKKAVFAFMLTMQFSWAANIPRPAEYWQEAWDRLKLPTPSGTGRC